MTEVFLERSFPGGMTRDGVLDMAVRANNCFDLHRVAWQGSFLSIDGRKLFCWFSGPDAESARIALRETGADTTRLWPGTVHHAPEAPPAANVLVERSFGEPVTVEEIQALEDRGSWCLDLYRVKFARTFFSLDRRRMICMYHAPDAESVRLAQRQAGMPIDDVWAFEGVND
jgi:hypothetical protein